METTIEEEVKFDPHLECSVCNDILFRPVSLNCGHTYCRDCLKNILATKPQCPLCRTPCFLQESALKENITLKNHIENLYPSHIKRRQNMLRTETKQEETKEGNISGQDQTQSAFNPMIIIPITVPSTRILFPGAERQLVVRIDYDPGILQSMCNDKKFLVVPDTILQERNPFTTCIFEFLSIRLIPNARNTYQIIAKACERVIVNDYNRLELDREALDRMGFNHIQQNISLHIGRGTLLKDENVGTNQQIEDLVNDLEEFLNQKLNQWMVSSPTSTQLVLNQLQNVLSQSQNRNMDYFINFSLTLARLVRTSDENKKRMFETTNTLERLLTLKRILEPLKDATELGIIFDIQLPGHKIFGNLQSAIFMLIGIILAMIFLKSNRFYF